MNKQDRKELERALGLIDEATAIVENIREAEQEKFDNMNEGLQQSEGGQKLEQNVSTLDDAISELEEAHGRITEASE